MEKVIFYKNETKMPYKTMHVRVPDYIHEEIQKIKKETSLNTAVITEKLIGFALKYTEIKEEEK